VAVLVAAGPAHAAAHLNAHKAIGIAETQPEAATVRTNPITNRFANLFSFIFFSFMGGLIWPNSVVIVS